MFNNDELKKLTDQVDKLTTQLAESLDINRQLIRKLEFQMAALDTLSRFVRENSAGNAAFGVTR